MRAARRTTAFRTHRDYGASILELDDADSSAVTRTAIDLHLRAFGNFLRLSRPASARRHVLVRRLFNRRIAPPWTSPPMNPNRLP